MKKMYEQIDVFCNVNNGVKIYRCFRCLQTEKVYVQSCDCFYAPFNLAQVENSKRSLLELFQEENIEKRTCGFDTTLEAILNFDEEFKDDDSFA